MKHDPKITANAVAVTTAVVYVACFLAVVFFPDLSMMIAQSWSHGFDLSTIIGGNLSLGTFVLGLATSTIGAWLVGYLFAKLYNYFLKS